MIRAQIQVTEEQMRSLRQIARREEISLSEAVRRCLDEAISRKGPPLAELYERAERLVGTFEDPESASDLSSGHDRYLDRAFR